MKDHFSFVKKAIVVSIGIVAIALFIVATLGTAQAATVTVSATVTNTVSCSVDNSSTAFGTLTAASVTTASPNVTSTLSCNSGGGCTLSLNDAGNGSSAGLYAAAATSTPIILSTTATLAAGTEGYGIQATTTGAGSGGTLSLSNTYNKSGNNVGGLSLSTTQLASSTLPVSGRQVTVTHLAAISNLTKAGTYSDTITYSCNGN